MPQPLDRIYTHIYCHSLCILAVNCRSKLKTSEETGTRPVAWKKRSACRVYLPMYMYIPCMNILGSEPTISSCTPYGINATASSVLVATELCRGDLLEMSDGTVCWIGFGFPTPHSLLRMYTTNS